MLTMQKLQPIFLRFMSIVLILNGTLLLVNWMRNENPNKDEMILWIAIGNVVVGCCAFFVAQKMRTQDKIDTNEDVGH